MSQPTPITRVWVSRDYEKCSGCRMCEIACSLHHEGRIWPEASMVRVFMLIPGVEIPHLCPQCQDYSCVKACPCNALSVNSLTGAVIVDKEKCEACSVCRNVQDEYPCVQKCPGQIPHLHPNRKYVVICDLCYGDPQCAKICEKAGYDALRTVERNPPVHSSYDSFAKTPEELTKDLAKKLYGEKAEELM